MNFIIEYPEDWIGIPHFGDGEVFATPEDWAAALATEVTAGMGLFSGRKQRRAALGETFAFLARELEAGGSDYGYIWLATLDGPLHFVATRALARVDIGDASAAELAGVAGEGDYVPPIVRDVVTEAGDAGIHVESHAPLDDEAVHVQVISGTYAFEDEEGVVLLQSSTTDMAGYEAFRPHYEEFARTFRWDRG